MPTLRAGAGPPIDRARVSRINITNGLTVLDLDAAYRFIVTGLVLLLAVAVDSIARKSRSSHGRG